MPNRSQKKVLLAIFMIIFVTAAPMFAARYLYHHQDLLPSLTTNHGTLLKPAINLSNINLKDAKHSFHYKDLGKRWRLAYVSTDCCQGKACRARTFEIHQLPKTLGRDAARIKSLLLIGKQCQIAPLTKKMPGLHIYQTNLKQSKLPYQNQLYIIDPNHFAMMRYTEKQAIQAVYQDLKQLLKVSQVG